MDVDIQNILYKPKRVRYTMLPNQIFDQKYRNNPQKNYKELVQLQSYQYMRVETLKNLKCLTRMSGNLDLYAGGGIDIDTARQYTNRELILRLIEVIVASI